MKKLPQLHFGTNSVFGGVSLRDIIDKINEIVEGINQREGIKEEVPENNPDDEIVGIKIS